MSSTGREESNTPAIEPSVIPPCLARYPTMVDATEMVTAALCRLRVEQGTDDTELLALDDPTNMYSYYTTSLASYVSIVHPASHCIFLRHSISFFDTAETWIFVLAAFASLGIFCRVAAGGRHVNELVTAGSGLK
jgi:hypothetical protein